MAGCGAAVATGAAWAARLAGGLVFALSEVGARLLGAPRLWRLYHAWLAGVVLLGPLVRPYADPHGVLAHPRSFLSRTFGEAPWGWTCLAAGGFGLVTSYGATGRALAALRPLARLAVGSALQGAAGAAFARLEALTGRCPAPPAGGAPWRGPGPALPAFRLTHCCLLLAAELAAFRPYLARGRPAGAALRLLFLLGAALLALLNLLLLAAGLHGPAPAGQALGAALATAAWHLTYRRWYRARCSPGRPAAGWGPPTP
ncbi:fat storage-inducing transmembrane protein 1 [Emydura macquarii macquarii]|uniref:fat storage-inducing transmembrane protein 1 n=1 Tax=Emydura macquarii macquarii TaxID=1129001 RepID=UPI00352A0DAD